MWFKMAASKVTTATTVLLVILMCGITASAVACTFDDCATCNDTQCTRCNTGFFLSGSNCVECTECSSDEYLKTPCGLNRDAQCLPCSDETYCAIGFYVSSRCTDTADRTCTACRVCSRGTYKTGGCEGTSDTICSPCKTCGATEYIETPCDFERNTGCAACFMCTKGETFEVAPCDGIHDRKCADCSADCPNGYYVSAECTVKADLQCAACGCADDEYINPPDSYCGSNTTSNYACDRCKTCRVGSEYVANECGVDTDTDCEPCDAPCGEGQYEATPCDGKRNRKCADCTKCGPGEEEKRPCRSKSNRVCQKKPTRREAFLQTCKNKFAQGKRVGLRCQQALCKNVPSYRRLYDCSRFLPRPLPSRIG